MAINDLSRIAGRGPADDRPALITFSKGKEYQAFSYSELEQKVRLVACNLRREGLETGSRVAVLGETSADTMIVHLGLLRAGCILVPINFKLPEEQQLRIIAHADCEALVHSERLSETLPSFDGIHRNFETLFSTDIQSTDHHPTTDRAMIMYTSGSSGDPKGVPLTHKGYLWAMERFHFLKDVISNHNTIIAAPLFHMNGQFHVLSVLMLGGTAVLLPDFSAEDFVTAAETYEARRLTGVPTMFELVTRYADERCLPPIDCVESIGMGSSPFTPSLPDRLRRIFPQAKVSNGYGTTEIGPATFGPHPDGLETPPLSIGYPMDGVQTSLRGGKDSGEGELFIKTGMQTEGYLNNDTLTDLVFKDGWYATGDLMHSDKDGFFYFDGRTDDMFVSGGENIHPSAIEKLLSTHPSVTEAAIVPLDDPVKGSIPVAFVVGDIAPEDLKAFALQNGPAYAHPRFIEVLPALPLAGTNKVDKSTLKRRAQKLFGGIRP